MRRRRLFTLSSAVSLLLCAAVCVMWVRSYFRYDTAALGTGTNRPLDRRDYHVLLARGRIAFLVKTFQIRSIPLAGIAEQGWSFESFPLGEDVDLAKSLYWRLDPPNMTFIFGFGYGYVSRAWNNGAITKEVAVMVPHAAVVLVTAMLPVAWVLHHRRERGRNRTGRCPSCGYDLRATPDRCPECGRGAGEDAA
jgi:predicted Zn-ribbon and HTH transcriptional regulator